MESNFTYDSFIVLENDSLPSTPRYNIPLPYPDFTQISTVHAFFVSVYVIVMAIAMFGNAAVCFTVFTNRKMHTAVNYYIVNLAFCDFMVGCFVLPVKLLELTAPAEWGLLNDGLCTAMMYLQTIVVFASVLTLVAICIERYVAVVHPFESRTHQTKARAKKILYIVWLVPCVVASPFLYPSSANANIIYSHYGVITRLTCFIKLPDSFRRGYYTFLFVFIYLMPLIFIAGTCFQVARCLLKDIPVHRQGSIRRQEANRRKVAKMVLIVVLTFIVAWSPYFLVSIVTQYQAVNFMHKGNFFFTMLCINLFAFLNSCANPFIYAAMSTRFRSGFFRCFRICCFLGLCPETDPEAVVFNPGPASNVHRHRQRFGCQIPNSCLITHSSSDSTSGLNTDSSQRTAYTMENSSKKIFFLHSLVHRNRKTKYVVQYMKNSVNIKKNSSGRLLKLPSTKSDKLAMLFEECPQWSAITKWRINKKNNSVGDLCLMEDSESESVALKRWNSCLEVRSSEMRSFSF